jgi:DNA-binding MarR family transcriptional regulator
MSNEPQWLDADEQAAWRRYRLMNRTVDAYLASELARDSGLSMQDYDVLSALSDAPDHRECAKKLVPHLLWSPSRLSHHIDRMQRRELVRRDACQEGPGIDILMTTQGSAAVRAAAPAHVSAVRRAFFDHLTADEVTVLERISTKVIAGLHAS